MEASNEKSPLLNGVDTEQLFKTIAKSAPVSVHLDNQ